MAVAFTLCVALTSCSKSNQDLIDQYRKASVELVEAAKAGDTDKVEKVQKEIEGIANDLDKRELSEQEEEEILEITSNMISAAFSGF